MSKTPFMPLWVADFTSKTLDLDSKEVGAYMLILMAMWGRDGVLPSDQKKLQRVARCGRDWPKVWAAIEHYFTVDGDTISNRRLTEELQKVAAKRAVSSQSGSLGGLAKALKTKKQALANATVSLQQPEPEPEPEKKTSVFLPKNPKRKSRIGDDAEVSEGMRRAAEKRGHSQQEAEAQFQKFKNDALAKGKTFVEWDRAFVTWLDSEYFKPITTQQGGKLDGQAADRARRAGERYAERLRARELDIGENRNSVVPLLSAGKPH